MKAIRVYKSKQELLDHLLRLPLTDRYLRFCSTLSDTAIEKYVDRLDLRGEDAVFAVFGADLQIIGMCHIAPYRDFNDGGAEMALSVDVDYRKQGIGDILFQRGILHCESLGIKKLYMNCLATNTPIQKLAKRSGMSVTTSYGESIANLNLEDKNAVMAFLQSLQNDTIGLYDANLQHTSNQWAEYVRMLTNIVTPKII